MAEISHARLISAEKVGGVRLAPAAHSCDDERRELPLQRRDWILVVHRTSIAQMSGCQTGEREQGPEGQLWAMLPSGRDAKRLTNTAALS